MRFLARAEHGKIHMSELRITSLPRRYLIPAESCLDRDEHGFFVAADRARRLSDFFSEQAVLVTAPPWMGKSFVARQLQSHFRANISGEMSDAPFGRLHHLTSFERYGGDADALPEWWEEWVAGDERACWIVDALDEDARSGGKASHRLLNHVEELTPEQRSRLLLLLFARENEVPPKIRERLSELYPPAGEGAEPGWFVTQLAPLDAAAAADFLGRDGSFQRVCRLIRANKLQSIAGYPSALDCLRRYPAGARVSDVQIWRDVLTDLLRDKNADEPLDPHLVPIDDQFRAAAVLAVVLTFGDRDEVDDGHGRSGHPSVDRLVRTDHVAGRLTAAAARSALNRRCSVARRQATGSPSTTFRSGLRRSACPPSALRVFARSSPGRTDACRSSTAACSACSSEPRGTRR